MDFKQTEAAERTLEQARAAFEALAREEPEKASHRAALARLQQLRGPQKRKHPARYNPGIEHERSPPQDWREWRQVSNWELRQQGWAQGDIADALVIGPPLVKADCFQFAQAGAGLLGTRPEPVTGDSPMPRASPT
jgi:hypothetical protein